MNERQLWTPRYLLDPGEIAFKKKYCDIVVIGGGISGLTTAIIAAQQGLKTFLITKDSLEESNSFYAQGGVAAALHSSDSSDLHIEDTLRVGDGHCDEEVVKIVVGEGPAAIRRLIEMGGEFDRKNGDLALSKEGGHSAPRVVHTRDSTGMEIQRVLIEKTRSLKNVTIRERFFALDLIEKEGRCIGVLGCDRDKGFCVILASNTILTSGGAGQIYRESTNPDVATGDGVAMAFRAGAQVRDMEFFQFHPTVLYLAGAPRILISETVRGEGGILRDKNGYRFMSEYHPSAELAPRDIVSRSILKQMLMVSHPNVYLDMTHMQASFLRDRFPGINEVCLRYGIDFAKDSIPVRPAAHYMIGGVRTDLNGRTSLPGLYASGEVTSSGLHGANRLGSNSLLEGLVFGWRSGFAASEEVVSKSATPPKKTDKLCSRRPQRKKAQYNLDIWDLRNSLRALMARNVGIERNGGGLSDAKEQMEIWAQLVWKAHLGGPSAWELSNMILLSRLIAGSALERTESRGVHFRKDFPERDDHWWKKSILYTRQESD